MNFSLIDASGVCINHVALSDDSDWQPPEGCILTLQSLNVGSTYSFDPGSEEWILLAAPRPSFEEESLRIRAERNRRLSDCDWTQLPDAPVDAAAWAAYRQALRDVTVQDGFPWDITWPEQP